MMENREYYTNFYIAICVFYFRKHLEQRVWGKELPPLISADERVQEENDLHKSQTKGTAVSISVLFK